MAGFDINLSFKVVQTTFALFDVTPFRKSNLSETAKKALGLLVLGLQAAASNPNGIYNQRGVFQLFATGIRTIPQWYQILKSNEQATSEEKLALVGEVVCLVADIGELWQIKHLSEKSLRINLYVIASVFISYSIAKQYLDKYSVSSKSTVNERLISKPAILDLHKLEIKFKSQLSIDK